MVTHDLVFGNSVISDWSVGAVVITNWIWEQWGPLIVFLGAVVNRDWFLGTVDDQ